MRRISNVILSNTLERMHTRTHTRVPLTCMNSLSKVMRKRSCAIDGERSLSVHFWSFPRSAPAHASKGTTREFARVIIVYQTCLSIGGDEITVERCIPDMMGDQVNANSCQFIRAQSSERETRVSLPRGRFSRTFRSIIYSVSRFRLPDSLLQTRATLFTLSSKQAVYNRRIIENMGLRINIDDYKLTPDIVIRSKRY